MDRLGAPLPLDPAGWRRRLALVSPRHGPGVVGGAEAVLGEAARGMAARGWKVEILTSCARDHFTWANEFPAGTTTEAGVTVRRFPVVNDTNGAIRAEVEGALVRGEHPSLEDQERWMNDSLRVPELYHWVLDHADAYRAIICAPYLFWTTFAVGQIAPERTILMPCLHDEAYARLELFDPLFEGVAGLWFLSDPERDLARRRFSLPADQAVVGGGVDVPEAYDPEAFRARHGLGDQPFLLYAGRREGGKGWEQLLVNFARATRAGDLDLDLVTFGVGGVDAPPEIAGRVQDLGFLDLAEVPSAFAAASAYLQPSRMESFSRTVMEAWLAGTPVIANASSAVVAWHCARSGAGLTYRDAFEFEQCVRYVAEAPGEAAALARSGRDYVIDNYTWPASLDRMEATIADWFPVDAETPAGSPSTEGQPIAGAAR